MTTTRGLAVEHLTVTFGTQLALDDVSISFADQAVHALLGPNGSGKSTLIKTLAGLVTPRRGAQLHLPDGRTVGSLTPVSSRQAGLRFVHQDLGLLPELSVLENLYLANRYPTTLHKVRWAKAGRQATEVLARVGIQASPRRAVGELPHGQRILVSVARAVMNLPASGGWIVVDEPTAALDERESHQLLSSLRELVARARVTVVLVTHRLPEVMEFAQRATVLRDGQVALEADTTDLTDGSLLVALGGTASAGARAASPDRQPARAGAMALAVKGLAGKLVREVSFSAQRGEIFGITGLEGCGKEELFRLLCGSQRRDAGRIEVDGVAVGVHSAREASRRGIGIVPGDRLVLGGIAELPVAENLMLPRLRAFKRHGVFRMDRLRAAASMTLVEYGVTPPEPRRAFGTLSGGNQQKTILARWLSAGVSVLLLQEPTAGVDVASRARIYAQLRDAALAGAAVVAVSSDVSEIAELCDRAAIMVDGRMPVILSAPDLSRENLTAASYDVAAKAAR